MRERQDLVRIWKDSLQRGGDIPVYISMNNEGEHSASESLTACWLHGRGQVTWPLFPEAHLCDGKRTRLTGTW